MDSFGLVALFGASAFNAALPGPCVILTAGRAARDGARSGLQISLGVLLGDVVLVATTLLVIAGVLSVSEPAFSALKWFGIAGLLFLAVRILRAAPSADEPSTCGGHRRLDDVAAGAVVGISSPYNLAFMIALLPQFIPAGALDLQTALLVTGVFLAGVALAQIGATAVGAYSLRLAGRRIRWIDYAGAASLIGFACLSVLTPLG